MHPRSDETYVVKLCNALLCCEARRGHTFEFLLGDTGQRLPVDAYYPEHKLVVEYHERQHSESVPLFDRKITVSGISRAEQRRKYDARRKSVLPKHGLSLVVIDYTQFPHTSRRKLRRKPQDIDVVRSALRRWLPANKSLERTRGE